MNSHTRLIYASNFKQIARENRGALSEFMAAVRKCRAPRIPGAQITALKGDGAHCSRSWRVETGKHDLFVKYVPNIGNKRKRSQTGYEQFVQLGRLAKSETNHVKVIRPLLGYTDCEHSFLVLPYVGLPHESSLPDFLKNKLKWFERRAMARYALSDFRINYFYDGKSGSLIVSDPYNNARNMPSHLAYLLRATLGFIKRRLFPKKEEQGQDAVLGMP